MESHTARVDPGQAVFAPSVWQRRIQFLKSQPAGRLHHASPLFYFQFHFFDLRSSASNPR
jgi:hypothetical protein